MCLEFRAVKWSRPCFLQASSHQSNKARWACKAINLGTRNLSPGQSLGAMPWYSLTQVCDWLLHTWLNGPKNHPATQVRPSFYTRWRALSLMSVRGFAKTNRPRLGYAELCSRPWIKSGHICPRLKTYDDLKTFDIDRSQNKSYCLCITLAI